MKEEIRQATVNSLTLDLPFITAVFYRGIDSGKTLIQLIAISPLRTPTALLHMQRKILSGTSHL